MIILLIIFALNVNASEIDINYKWYKYESSSYMSINESKNMESYIDYNDYILDEYYDITNYNNTKGKYIYIYNKTGKGINIDSIDVYIKGVKRDYYILSQLGTENPIYLSSKGKLMLDLKSIYYLKDISIDIKFKEGILEVNFSNQNAFKDNKLASETITESGIYTFNHIKNTQEILYKTYYNRIDGNYQKESYEDYIYKDINDYKINYFFYNNTITNKDTKIEELLDTNYTFIKYEGEINYDVNGKYKIKLIFSECEKEIEITVAINENEKLKQEIEEKNEIIKTKESIIENLNNEIYKLNSKIQNDNIEIENQIKIIQELKKQINEFNNENEKLKQEIEEKNEIIKTKESIIENLNNEIYKLNSKIQNDNIEIENQIKIMQELKKQINNFNKEKDKLIKNLKQEIKEKNKIINLNNKEIKSNKEKIKKLEENITELNIQIENIKNEINTNKIIYEKNKENHKKLVELKNACFEELKKMTKLTNETSKQIAILNKKYENKEDYYQRYIKKLKYIIDEKDVEYWNIKKSSIFVGFKKFW